MSNSNEIERQNPGIDFTKVATSSNNEIRPSTNDSLQQSSNDEREATNDADNINAGVHSIEEQALDNNQSRNTAITCFFNWLSRLHLQLRLENTGSVARDHLASERTFLAYVRTSLTIASAGVALLQLFTLSGGGSTDGKPSPELQKYGRPLGGVIIILGLVVLIIGSTRYFTVQIALINGYFPPARDYMAFITITLSTLIVVAFSVLLAVT